MITAWDCRNHSIPRLSQDESEDPLEAAFSGLLKNSLAIPSKPWISEGYRTGKMPVPLSQRAANSMGKSWIADLQSATISRDNTGRVIIF